MRPRHDGANDANRQDGRECDVRWGRTAGMSIRPTTTGAAKAVTLVSPELEGRLDGRAFRVPTATVSVTDLVVSLEKNATVEDVNEAYRQASMNDHLHGLLGYSTEPLVSIDYKGNANSCTIDALSTAAAGGNMVKWEWFQIYGELPTREANDRIVQSWDTASKAAELNDYSVCTTWLVKGNDYYLIDVVRERLEYPNLKHRVLKE